MCLQYRKPRNPSSDLTDTNSDFCYITIRRIKKIVDLRDDAVDQVRLVSHILEEQVEIGSATIRFRLIVETVEDIIQDS